MPAPVAPTRPAPNDAPEPGELDTVDRGLPPYLIADARIVKATSAPSGRDRTVRHALPRRQHYANGARWLGRDKSRPPRVAVVEPWHFPEHGTAKKIMRETLYNLAAQP